MLFPQESPLPFMRERIFLLILLIFFNLNTHFTL